MTSQKGTIRGQARREEILVAATKLFRRNGFERVTIDEIGAAVGVSGPAIYRHFDSKDDLLISIFDLAVDRLEAAAPDARQVAADPRSALRTAIAGYLDLVVPNRRLAASYLSTAVWTSPTPGADRLRRRQLKHVDRVVKMLRAARPELSLPQARTLAHATFGVLNSVAWSGLVIDQKARDVLEVAAMATLFSDPLQVARTSRVEPKRRSA